MWTNWKCKRQTVQAGWRETYRAGKKRNRKMRFPPMYQFEPNSINFIRIPLVPFAIRDFISFSFYSCGFCPPVGSLISDKAIQLHSSECRNFSENSNNCQQIDCIARDKKQNKAHFNCTNGQIKSFAHSIFMWWMSIWPNENNNNHFVCIWICDGMIVIDAHGSWLTAKRWKQKPMRFHQYLHPKWMCKYKQLI